MSASRPSRSIFLFGPNFRGQSWPQNWGSITPKMGFVPNSVAPSIPIAHPAVGRFLDGFVVVEPSDGGLGLPLHLALEFELLAGTGHEVAQG